MPATVPFVTLSKESGLYSVSQQAVELLGRITGPVGVIAIAGKHRTGKSFLLNHCLFQETSGGFEVASTVQPCTKGLWLHTQLLETDQASQVLVIDTEGLGATDANTTHDTTIFSLALMLSSLFLYNSVGAIDEAAIESLSFVANVSKHIWSKVGSGSVDVSSFFPVFVWLLRDFSLRLEDEGGAQIDANMYLENALGDTSNPARVELCQLLRRYFVDRSCLTLARPCEEENALQQLASGVGQLRDIFKEQMTRLREHITSNVPPKQLFGSVVTGDMLLSLAQEYVSIINAGAVPVVEDCWTMVLRNQAQEAKTLALAEFKRGLQRLGLPMPPTELNHVLKQLSIACHQQFRDHCLGDELPKSDQHHLEAEVTALNEQTLHENHTAVAKNLLELTDGFVSGIKDEVKFSEVRKRLETLQSNVQSQLGREAQSQITEELQHRLFEWVSHRLTASEETTTQQETSTAALRESNWQLQKQLQAWEEQKHEVEELRRQVEQQKGLTKQQVEKEQAQLAAEKNRYWVLQKHMSKQQTAGLMQTSELRERVQAVILERDRLAQQLHQKTEDMVVQQKQVEKFRELAEERSSLQSKVEQLEHEVAALQQELSDTDLLQQTQTTAAMKQVMDIQADAADMMTSLKRAHSTEREKLTTRVARLESTLAVEKSDWEAKWSSKCQQLEEYETKLQRHHARADQLMREKEELHRKLVQTEPTKKVQELQDQLESLKSTTLDQHTKYATQVQEATTRAVCAEARLQDSKERVQRLESNGLSKQEFEHNKVLMLSAQEESKRLRREKQGLAAEIKSLRKKWHFSTQQAKDAQQEVAVLRLRQAMRTKEEESEKKKF